MNPSKAVRRSYVVAVLLAGMTLFSSAYAQGDRYPDKPVTFVVPYPAGGVADQFARSMATELGKRLGQSVVVSNRAGANGNIGSAYVAKQPADGYTLLLGSTSTLAVNPHLYKDMGYDPIKDLQPVTLTHQMPNVLIVGAGTPYKNVKDVIKAAKAEPGRIPFGSAGNGNSMHLAGELFQKQSGIKLMHVPYKGAPPALTDVIGGALPTMFINLPAVVSYAHSDKLRILTVAAAQRSKVLPDVPTFEQAGVPGVISSVWNGILVRSGTPDVIVNKLNQNIVSILQAETFRQPLESQGYEVLSSTPQEFADLLQKDTNAMGEQVRDAGIHID
ncbi:Bug family tripartite tricarboxylate transporter substrate binding protein [Advenella mimigardefordensis]|uniref:Putative Bug-like extracytoplasmic solute binding receptor, TTT family n=1 Tax=Advenella mimigardefordensis (strain DSM 17166 / LMG 22922 / DPN7) TaxID=1247726 RepID=W0P5Z4_ADVMD|nr:tripartite tricarboxylate transporter substrate binding protein [Advenella mimigardefordensis]AHG62274.1 putative Bug-like extracytoplasmic solute binding receptor, TTT family [Advenella mimigardefordensis DPN7]